VRYGVHKVFGTHALTHSRIHSQTAKPECSIPPAPFFNGAGGIKIDNGKKCGKSESS